jgi:hypothetical protein
MWGVYFLSFYITPHVRFVLTFKLGGISTMVLNCFVDLHFKWVDFIDVLAWCVHIFVIRNLTKTATPT